MSSLLYLYSGIQEAVRQSDWLFAILRRYSVFSLGKQPWHVKFNVKPYSLPIPTIICNLFPKIRRKPSYFIFEAAMKVSRILGPFSLQTNRAYFPQSVCFQFVNLSSAEFALEQRSFSVDSRCLADGEIHNVFQQMHPDSGRI